MLGLKTKEQRERIILFKRVFGSHEGREVLCELMDKYHVIRPHDGDAYKEGQRSVVLEIMKRANMDMAAFDKLLKGG